MAGRVSNDKYENEIERMLYEMIDNQNEKVRAEYDAIQQDVLNEISPLFLQWQGQTFTKTNRDQVQNIIQRIINDHHQRIRKEVQKTSNNAATIGFSGVQYQTEQKNRIAIPAAAMLLSIYNKDYKKSRAHNDYTAKNLSDGKNYNDRLRRNHGKLIRELTNAVGKNIGKFKQGIGEGFADAAGLVDLEKDLEKAIEKVAKRTQNIQKVESERVKAEAENDSAKEMAKEGIRTIKTWESRGDHKVRDTHRRLHGTTLEYDEYFHTRNGKALSPKTFGRAEEDINCRCRLHSVKWLKHLACKRGRA